MSQDLRAIYQAAAPDALAWPWDAGLRAVYEAGRAAAPVAQPTDEQIDAVFRAHAAQNVFDVERLLCYAEAFRHIARAALKQAKKGGAA